MKIYYCLPNIKTLGNTVLKMSKKSTKNINFRTFSAIQNCVILKERKKQIKLWRAENGLCFVQILNNGELQVFVEMSFDRKSILQQQKTRFLLNKTGINFINWNGSQNNYQGYYFEICWLHILLQALDKFGQLWADQFKTRYFFEKIDHGLEQQIFFFKSL